MRLKDSRFQSDYHHHYDGPMPPKAGVFNDERYQQQKVVAP
jgi:hypothetical protein